MNKKRKKQNRKYKSIFIEKSLPELIEVEWEDHFSQASWIHKDDIQTRPIVNRTVGYKIHETNDLLYMAGTISENEYLGRSGGIIKKDIKKIRKIK